MPSVNKICTKRNTLCRKRTISFSTFLLLLHPKKNKHTKFTLNI